MTLSETTHIDELTPDGTPVDFYANEPAPDTQIEMVTAELDAGCTVVEFGCGTGALCAALERRGFRTLGLDESESILQHAVTEVRCVRAETYRHPHPFDAVVIAGFLLNTVGPATRDALLRSARANLRPSGKLIVERHHRAMFTDRLWPVRHSDEPLCGVLTLDESVPGLQHARLWYTDRGREWYQDVTADCLGVAGLDSCAHRHGLHRVSAAAPDARWVTYEARTDATP